MAAIFIELPYDYSSEDLNEFFDHYNLRLIRKGSSSFPLIKEGDALQSKSGVIARIMSYEKNEVGEPHILIANKKLSKEDLFCEFRGTTKYSEQRPSTSFMSCDEDPDGVYEDLAYQSEIDSEDLPF